jgi:hypothetical protein
LTGILNCIAPSQVKWYSLLIRNTLRIEFMDTTFRIKEVTLKTTIMKILLAIVALKSSMSFSAEFPSNENEAVSPLYIRSWYHAFYEEDKRGTLSKIKNSISEWDYMDQMVENHDLASEVRGNVGNRKKYVTENMLKFFERKISEEGKSAEGNYTFVAMAKMNSGLRPGASMGLSNAFKFKFRGQLLQGNGTVVVVNPYLDFNVRMDLRKGAFVEGSKKFESLDVTSTLNYNLKDGLATFKVKREIARDLNADVTYENGPATHNAGDVSLKLMYSRAF